MSQQEPPSQEQAFLAAYDAYADAIFRHCYFRLMRRERAKELMQETFLRTWETVRQGTEIRNMRAFLYRVANNLIIDEVRKRKEVSLEALQQEGFDPAGTEDLEELHHRLDATGIMEGLKRLRPEARQLITLRYIDGLPPADIAELLGKSPNAVSVSIHRGLRELRSLICHG